MKRRIFFSLLLLTSMAILSSILLFSEKPRPDTAHELVSEIDANKIERISIHRNNGNDLGFQKFDGQWFITSPLRARANMSRINSMLGLVNSKSLARIEVGASPLAVYQLQAPALTLQLDNDKFLFGGTDPLDKRRYLLFNDTIHLVSDNLFYQLQQAPMFYVSPKLVPDEESVDSIRFADRLLSRVNDNWVVLPPGTAIDNAFLQQLAGAWQVAEAGRVQQYLPLQSPEKVTLTFASGRSASFEVLRTASGLVLGRPDLKLQYEVDTQVAEKLLWPQFDAASR